MKYESLKEGWIPKKDAAEFFSVDPSTVNRWHNKHPECFEVISGKNANVNVELIKKVVYKL